MDWQEKLNDLKNLHNEILQPKQKMEKILNTENWQINDLFLEKLSKTYEDLEDALYRIEILINFIEIQRG